MMSNIPTTQFPGHCIWNGCVCRTPSVRNTGRRPVCADLRFLRNVQFGSECWLYAGTLNTYGYGQISGPPADKRLVQAHIYAWLRSGNEIPTGMVLRHKCDNKVCVKPSHLEIGTPKDNVRDTWDRGRSNPRGRTLNKDTVRALRHDRDVGMMSYRDLADKYEIGYTTVARACTGRTSKDVSLYDLARSKESRSAARGDQFRSTSTL